MSLMQMLTNASMKRKSGHCILHIILVWFVSHHVATSTELWINSKEKN